MVSKIAYLHKSIHFVGSIDSTFDLLVSFVFPRFPLLILFNIYFSIDILFLSPLFFTVMMDPKNWVRDGVVLCKTLKW